MYWLSHDADVLRTRLSRMDWHRTRLQTVSRMTVSDCLTVMLTGWLSDGFDWLRHLNLIVGVRCAVISSIALRRIHSPAINCFALDFVDCGRKRRDQAKKGAIGKSSVTTWRNANISFTNMELRNTKTSRWGNKCMQMRSIENTCFVVKLTTTIVTQVSEFS